MRTSKEASYIISSVRFLPLCRSAAPEQRSLAGIALEMLRCPTQLLDGRCWLLSQPGKSCASTCEREKDVDLQWMHLARIQEAALSLEQLYGFQATNAEDLRQPCAGNSMAVAKPPKTMTKKKN